MYNKRGSAFFNKCAPASHHGGFIMRALPSGHVCVTGLPLWRSVNGATSNTHLSRSVATLSRLQCRIKLYYWSHIRDQINREAGCNNNIRWQLISWSDLRWYCGRCDFVKTWLFIFLAIILKNCIFRDEKYILYVKILYIKIHSRQ